ncbi:hypothetical protein GCM10008023_07700 [Sphingomonas glacialis]|uniref:Uncharacterized protein n=1 Tax=Sphingomonas glacialis TaxID=658225 RepID=A0ABQ3LAB2_9SPHN|nr:hypothetical protein GCM10008023_07700 [Sphingomonas glacialis]
MCARRAERECGCSADPAACASDEGNLIGEWLVGHSGLSPFEPLPFRGGVWGWGRASQSASARYFPTPTPPLKGRGYMSLK